MARRLGQFCYDCVGHRSPRQGDAGSNPWIIRANSYRLQTSGRTQATRRLQDWCTPHKHHLLLGREHGRTIPLLYIRSAGSLVWPTQKTKQRQQEAPPGRNAWGCLVVHSRKFFSARAPSRLATWWSPPIRRSSVPCPRRPLSRSDNGSPHKSWLAKPRPYSPGFASTCG